MPTRMPGGRKAAYEKRAAKRPLSTNTKTKLDLIDESKIFTNLRMPLQIYCKLFIFQRK